MGRAGSDLMQVGRTQRGAAGRSGMRRATRGPPGGEGTRGARAAGGRAASSGRGNRSAPLPTPPPAVCALGAPRPARPPPHPPSLPPPPTLCPAVGVPRYFGPEGPTPSHFPSVLQPSGLLQPGNELAPPPASPRPSPPSLPAGHRPLPQPASRQLGQVLGVRSREGRAGSGTLPPELPGARSERSERRPPLPAVWGPRPGPGPRAVTVTQ